ncbi:MAG: hypothetical protein HC806_03990 [Anaerolineae bacterium]|nr:hypothetical protein [Anaerolineae bacterium]
MRGLQPGDLAGVAASISPCTSVTGAGATGFAGGTATTQRSQPRTAASLPDHVRSTTPEQVITQIGTVDPSHYDYAKGLLAQIPASLRQALRQPQSASQMIYALMLDRENPFTYQQQVEYLQQVEAAAGIQQVFEFHTQLANLNSRLYLPMLDLAIPALRQKSAQDCQRVLKAVHELAKLDGQWTLSEFVSYLVLQHRLEPHIGQPQSPSVVYEEITPVWNDCLILVAALAKIGSKNPEAMAFAFRSGLFRLPGASQNPAPTSLPKLLFAGVAAEFSQNSRRFPKAEAGNC